MKRNLTVRAWMALLILASTVRAESRDFTSGDRPNILFIIIDDMNVDPGCYGGPVISPRIDRLAESGVRFSHAYVQQPVCAASRASFLTGLRPNTTGVDYPYSHYFLEEILPEYGTVSRYFSEQGYRVRQFGKIHHGIRDEIPTYTPKRSGRYVSDSLNRSVREGGEKPPVEKTCGLDSAFADYKIATEVATAIRSAPGSDRPFFYAVGFHKPHLVFAAPETYWDLYDEEEIRLPVPKNLAEGAPGFAVDRYYLNQYDWEHADPEKPFSDEYARMVRHAYYASSSFVDAQVGRVLDALEESGLEEETLVLFVSDHGFLVGEHNYWGKTNLFERGLQVPLIVSWKGTIDAGNVSPALVEAVDIFPTLADMAGLRIPGYLEGTSFAPVLEDPDRPWKKGALSQQPRGLTADREGSSLRTDRYRYTEWVETSTGKVIARELYDYATDPTESVNLASRPGYGPVVEELAGYLRSGWKSLLPDGLSNSSSLLPAPPSYAWGPEGVSRREAWHREFGGSEKEGWRAATRRRMEQQRKGPSLESRIEGMLIGSAIGDAAGGPVEFVHPPQRSRWCTTGERVTPEGIKELGWLFRLRSYPKEWEPFAQWESFGPPGTVTDDTRFKMIFFNTLKEYDGELTLENFARSVLAFREALPSGYREQYDAWIPEIAYATRWALGEREEAFPVERIWGGIPTMEGQMPFLPLAALAPYDPEWCYLKCYELGYFDIGVAKDMNSALVAGLARALQPDGSWETFEKAMRTTDPYRYGEVLYVYRQLLLWLDRPHRWVEESGGNIARLFDIMEENLEAFFWWEAWVPVAVVLACAEIVDYDPLASMQLIMEFGHDTDSYAQVMGAVLGAIHGKEVWPPEMRATVNARMKEQFGQNVDDWMELIRQYGNDPSRP